VTDPSSNDLLGFMLGALDADDHQHFQATIDQDHELKEELQNLRLQVAPLDQLDPPGAPPAGLARRTCEFIATQPAISIEKPDKESKPEVVKSSRRRWFRENSNESSGRRRNSVMDFVIVAVALMLMAAIALPALNKSRHQRQMLACQNNLRTVGMGLLEYAENSGGKYISMPEDGSLSFAGVYAPELLERGFVEDPNAFMCAGAGNDKQHFIPSIRQLMEADQKLLRQYQKRAGGDFAYTMGQWKNGQYDAGENLHRRDYILLADNPSASQPGRASINHGGYGQNVFFEDGRVDFLDLPEYEGDAIYENDWGGVAPGAHPGDIVLVPSATKFIKFKVD